MLYGIFTGKAVKPISLSICQGAAVEVWTTRHGCTDMTDCFVRIPYGIGPFGPFLSFENSSLNPHSLPLLYWHDSCTQSPIPPLPHPPTCPHSPPLLFPFPLSHYQLSKSPSPPPSFFFPPSSLPPLYLSPSLQSPFTPLPLLHFSLFPSPIPPQAILLSFYGASAAYRSALTLSHLMELLESGSLLGRHPP